MRIQVICLNRLLFIPYIHGSLRAYIEQYESTLANDLRWNDPIFIDEPAEQIANRINVDVLALSCYVWNFKKQMKIAKLVSQRNPNTYIIAGGPHIPNQPWSFFDDHPYIDVIVHGEGEITFANILKLHMNDNHAYQLPGTSTADHHHPSMSLYGEKLPKDIQLDSPYFAGYLDSAVQQAEQTGMEYWVPWETNRGCPYSCAFCLDEHSWVYTNNGVVSMKDAINTDDITHVWSSYGMQPITRKIKRTYSGNMISLKLQGRPSIRCTPEHKWLTTTGWKQASSINVGDKLVSSKPLFSEQTHINVKDILPELLIENDHVKYPRSKKSIPACIPLSNEFMRLAGLFIADGSTSFSKTRPNSCTISWTFNKKEIDLQTEVIDSIYSIFGLHAYRSDTGTAIQISINNSVIGNLFRNLFGDKSTTKRIPHSWMGLKEELIIPLIKGYLDGDGCFYVNYKNPKGRWIASTVSKTLAFQLQIIFGRFGKKAALHFRKPLSNYIQNRKVNINPSYRIEFPRSLGIESPIESVSVKGIQIEHYDGEVFNLEVNGQPVYSVYGLETHNCDWGSSLLNLVRKFSIHRLGHDIDYFGVNNIANIYICDANFGMLPVDEGITNALVSSKALTGYPKQIRGSFAKNSNKRVFDITKSLMDAKMIYGTTLSVQSMNEDVLAAVDRTNIGTKKYRELQEQYHAEGYHTYSELIIPLPNETKDTFLDGMCELIESGNHEDIRVWELSILPNAPMVQHIDKYGIKTVIKNVFLEMPNTEFDEIETNHVAIETATMPFDDWVYSYLFAWTIQALHCGYYTRYLSEYLNRELSVSYRQFYQNLIDHSLADDSSLLGQVLNKVKALLMRYPNDPSNTLLQKAPGFGPTRRNPSDWIWLMLCNEKERFYTEIRNLIFEQGLWSTKFDDLTNFQQQIMLDPKYTPYDDKFIKVSHNWRGYFLNDDPLKQEGRMYIVKQTHTGIDDKYSLNCDSNAKFANAAIGTGFLISRHRHYAHPLTEIVV